MKNHITRMGLLTLTALIGTAFLVYAVIFNGGPGNDIFTGSAGADIIRGFGGSDNLDGIGGNDFIDGGTGNDTGQADGPARWRR
jgi:Ca2+-binding RTX toxin-like protein